MSSGHKLDGLLIAMLFCPQKDKNRLVGKYVMQNVTPSSPFFSLLLILLDAVRIYFKL